ncbi:MAG TPA: phosphate ABC transporter permease subunit PstC [Micromonosporaceae bacterium]|jgi:phosphate transport system permease protein|nr:phosphate ABC transporter permease subunit PstC [Micromonosporaceae bacterium]
MSEPTFAGFAEVATTSAEPTARPDEPTDGSTRHDIDGSATGPPGGEPGQPVPPLGGGGALPRRRRWSLETAFRGLTSGAGLAVLAIIVAIAVFLIVKAIPALNANHANFLTFKNWFPGDNPPVFGIAALAFGTVVTSFIALLIAVPIAICIALCLTHYAPPRVGSVLGFAIDILAAVPSIVYGLWGRDYLVQPVSGLSAWLHTYFGWIPIFGSDGPYGKSIMLGSIVLSIMILPILTALIREVFAQTPTMNEEAALALGATKWEMIRTAVLPFGRPGIIAATILGLGRALGETMALALTLGSTFTISADLLGNGGNTIAANIANNFGEADQIGRGALIASGLVLFAITLVVNVSARAIIYRRREFQVSAA